MTSSISLIGAPQSDPDATGGIHGSVVHLTAGGVSVVFAPDVFGLPFIAHWGGALSQRDLAGLLASAAPAVMNSSLDVARSFSVAAGRSNGWSGTPVVEARADAAVLEAFTLVETRPSADAVAFRLRDATATAELHLAYRLDSAGVLHVALELHNTSRDRTVDVGAVRALLPLPARATETLDFTGRWTKERHAQRADVRDGTWARASRRGRPGHDSSFLTVVGTRAFGFRHGEIWSAHVAWSGNQTMLVERLPEGAGVHSTVLGGGELLDTGEVTLGPGQAYAAPTVVFGWSDAGIDGLTARHHGSIRSRPNHPITVRPLLLNTWEAMYFDHDHRRLSELAVAAARVGVERFVLDDGWFRGRRRDDAGLGDWFADDERWPRGLRPLSDEVHALGMEFGLWFEPEMISPDSELARAHPDWVLGEEPLLEWRHQFVLDFSRSEVATHILDRLEAIIGESAIDFIKWDHNRDLHAALGGVGDRRVHAHTLGVYRVLEELRRRHPRLEIESCASGGGRVDLGVLQYTDRIWASDTNDPVERQHIQRWTQILVPPELIGSHIGPPVAHTTQRHADFAFRAVTALFNHAGIEWDLTRCDREALDAISTWAELYRELRPLLHTGVTVRADHVDDGALLHGVVNHAATEGIFCWARTSTSATGHTPRVPVPGMRADRVYRVRVRTELGTPSRHQIADPAWLFSAAALTVTGAVLAEGIPLPVLNPGQALLLHIVEDRGQDSAVGAGA